MIETENILKGCQDGLINKIEKLNRKAIKIGCSPITLTFGEDIVEKYTDEYGRKKVTVYVPATIDYDIPIIDGWKLISTFDIYTASKEHDYKAVVTTSTVPGETVPAEYMHKEEIGCDHCGHNRLRTHSMLMQNVETLEYKEVGSTCVKDFFGHDPAAFLRWASFSFMTIIKDEEDRFEGGGGHCYYEDLLETLIFTSATIRKFGWMSRGRAYKEGHEFSTSDEVLVQMNPHDGMEEDDKVHIEDKDREIAEAAIEYFSNIDDPNDYLTNCYKLTMMGYVPRKHMGLACSMVPSYKRVADEKREADKDTSEYVGTIGDRIKGIEVEVIFMKEINTYYGLSELYMFRDADGNNYKTFYSGGKWGAEAGDKVLLTGTVKKHEEYKGKKSTMLSRCIVTAQA